MGTLLAGPALQALATIISTIITHIDKQLELASPAERDALLEERRMHEHRLNWLLDRIFGLMGYVAPPAPVK